MKNKPDPHDTIYKQYDRLETYCMVAAMYMLTGIPIFHVLNFVALATRDEAYFEAGGVIALSTATTGLLAVLALDMKTRSVKKEIGVIEEIERQELKIRENKSARVLLLVLAMELKDRYEYQEERELSLPEFYNLLQSMPSSLDIDLLAEKSEIIMGH